VSHILLFDSNNATRTKLASDLNNDTTTNIFEVSTVEQAREALNQLPCSVLFFQLSQDDHESLDFFIELNNKLTPIVSVLLVPEDTTMSTKTILQSGAHFFLHAPYSQQEIAQISHRALQQHLTQQLATPRAQRENGFLNIIGQSESMCQLFNLIQRLGDDGDSTILIQGESGTGKELVAKALHTHSPRQQNNFVPLNCAAIPEELLESELFGYEKGAFTGAINNKKGRIQHAHGGTLFLDEIGDMKPSLQAKLLRVIQEKEFEPVGSVKSIKVDVRIVAATHRNLDEAVAKGTFREDLYYRLNVIPLHIPPLRQRGGDIRLLLDTFTQRFCTNKRRNVFTYSDQTLIYLTRYPWPGNVRELENLVQRFSILHMGEIVHPKDLPEKYLYHQKEETTAGLISEGGATDFNSRVSEFEDRLILQALVQAGGNKKEAAELLNLKRTTLLEKIKKKQLDKALTELD
jgi:DNA-binding NtrC family response regulator